jgi:hypothetical protein
MFLFWGNHFLKEEGRGRNVVSPLGNPGDRIISKEFAGFGARLQSGRMVRWERAGNTANYFILSFDMGMCGCSLAILFRRTSFGVPKELHQKGVGGKGLDNLAGSKLPKLMTRVQTKSLFLRRKGLSTPKEQDVSFLG